jgi:hypothetical protein
MIVGEALLASVFGPDAAWGTLLEWVLVAVSIAGVLATGRWAAQRRTA